MKVLAAVSGGVDSSVAAARAKAAGHDVTCVHMALTRHREPTRTGSRGCCSIEDASDARRAAAVLGLDYYVWDLSEEFEDLVVRDFIDSYDAGRTPNPCVRCNEFVKFQVLLRRGLALGFDAVATGHYARLEGGSGGVVLRRSVDRAKDQSYVLAVAGPDALGRCLFPLGDAPSKAAVRAEAAALGLPTAEKPDSYDICFVASGDTRGFLRERLGSRPGPVLDQAGVEVGRHDGAFQFTVGQRRGLALGRPAPDGRPRYVTAVDTATNVVRVGPVGLLDVRRFGVEAPVWLDQAARGVLDGGVLRCQAQIRAHGEPLDCTVQLDREAATGPAPGVGGGSGPAGGGSQDRPLTVMLDRPARGLAAGQTAVLYSGDTVLAAGVVRR